MSLPRCVPRAAASSTPRALPWSPRLHRAAVAWRPSPRRTWKPPPTTSLRVSRGMPPSLGAARWPNPPSPSASSPGPRRWLPPRARSSDPRCAWRAGRPRSRSVAGSRRSSRHPRRTWTLRPTMSSTTLRRWRPCAVVVPSRRPSMLASSMPPKSSRAPMLRRPASSAERQERRPASPRPSSRLQPVGGRPSMHPLPARGVGAPSRWSWSASRPRSLGRKHPRPSPARCGPRCVPLHAPRAPLVATAAVVSFLAAPRPRCRPVAGPPLRSPRPQRPALGCWLVGSSRRPRGARHCAVPCRASRWGWCSRSFSTP